MLGVILGAVGLGGSLLSGFGTYMQGAQADKAAKYNAYLLQQRATATEQSAASESALMTENARALRSKQIATSAKMGADITSGTPLIVLADQMGKMQQDILERRRTRAIEASGYRQQADMMLYQGKQARASGILGAASTILGGAAQTGMSFI